MNRPYVLSIAGFDPCGGAGILADAKTMEANKVMGLGVISAITFQHEEKFTGLQWVPLASLLEQLNILFEKYSIDFVKVGIIESLETLQKLIDFMKGKNPAIKIIWDPILKASAGYAFHAAPDRNLFEAICKNVFLVTPNRDEIGALYSGEDVLEASRRLAKLSIVYLKGGHDTENPGKDYLLTGKKEFTFKPKVIAPFGKHGTGCVFSAALTSNIARDFPLTKAVLRAKNYITYFLLSNKTMLGFHK